MSLPEPVSETAHLVIESPRAGNGTAGVALAVALLPLAAVLLLFSLALTAESQSPEDYPGLRDNLGPLALVFLALSAAATTLVLLAARRLRRLLRIAVVPLCVLLLVGAGYRGWTLAPLLKCGGHGAVARQPDGSFACYDR
ncbi:hypothetical protein [Kitasatospora paranensis]|uniref:Uncharacterized protein n=1 Tax=Kitasatospora paranensis TaxID=258053 RepID=A0ABW2FWE8_9ACTN